jgi:hypothetical protein
MIKDGEVRPEGCTCEPYSDILPNWKDVRIKFGYTTLSDIVHSKPNKKEWKNE